MGLAAVKAALRALSDRLYATGYVDAVVTRGVLTVRTAIASDLESLPPATATLVELFSLRRSVDRSRVDGALDTLGGALIESGVLVERERKVSTLDLVVLPVFGRLMFVPSPRGLPTAYFGDDEALLLARMALPRRSALVLHANAGVTALHAASLGARVVAFESDPVALACAELNLEMNDVDHVAIQSGGLDAALARGERFERVFAALPTTPLPVTDDEAGHASTGPAVLARILSRASELLDEDGLLQVASVLHGNDAGPMIAAAPGLDVVVTAISRQPITPGSPLFDAFTTGLAATKNADARLIQRTQQQYLGRAGISHLYFASLTGRRSAASQLAITRHWVQPGGGWQRRA